jgi:predicted  nucleic acid-binding Zn-ribbon protein
VARDVAPDVAAPVAMDVAAPIAVDVAAPVTTPVTTDVVMDVSGPVAAAAPAAGQNLEEKRGDSFDDFAQEGPPVSELADDRTVPTARPGNADPTMLMDRPGPDRTQLVREREGDLPRRQGVLGDLRYLFTAIVGVVKTRKQLRDLREKLEVEREARKGLVRLMARELLDSRAVDVDAVREARALLDEVETERARHATDVVAATSVIAALEEDGEAESLAADAEIGRIAGAIADLDQEIEELEHVVAGHHRHLNQKRVEGRRLERRIARLDKRLDSDSAEEVAKIQSELVAVRAMHETALAAQPRIAAEIQTLLPRIEALQARQAGREAELPAAQERVQAIEEQYAQRSTAAQARKDAAERALAATADEVRELVAGLGERLCLERPERAEASPGMARMAMVDGCDSAMADIDRQILERSERLRRIDRAAVARGGLLALGLGAVMAALIWLGLML